MDRIEKNLPVSDLRPSPSRVSTINRSPSENCQSTFKDNCGKFARVSRRPSAEAAPLSFGQEQIWLQTQIDRDPALHNRTVTICRRGSFDVAVLERCLLEIVRRHEIWRTTFEQVGDQPVQIVSAAPRPLTLRVVDLRSSPEPKRESESARLAERDAAIPFELDKAPLLRALLVSLSDQEHRLYLTLHEIVLDAVTASQVLLPEIEAIYEAFSKGKTSSLPEPNLHYADFACWQRQTLSPEICTDQLGYWRKQLDGVLPVSQWPGDRPRSGVASHSFSQLPFTLPNPLAQQIRTVSQNAGATVYVTLLAGFAALLQRCTGQEEVVLGGLSPGRKHTEIAQTAGHFENPLALRISISGNPAFSELQERVRAVVLDAQTHDLVPFARVAAEFQQEPDASHHPLFQIVISQQPEVRHLSPGWELITNQLSSGGSKLDLAIAIHEPGSGISATFTYNPDLFDASTIRRLMGSWQTLLESACGNPGQRISDLLVLSDAERRQILVDWNKTEVELPHQRLLHEWFEAQVEKAPSARALTFEDRHLTYRQLNDRANQLAHYLKRAGVGPDVLVGLFLERSLEMVVGLLGILKAGGAYVPIDPEYPPERVAFMLEDTAPPVLLVQGRFKSSVRRYGGQILCLDDEWSQIAREETSNLPRAAAKPGSLAYMIYTSGSTGMPKGAMNTHRGICNRLLWMQRQYRLTTSDAVLQKTPFSFDVSVWEFFWPLITGARLIVAKPEVHRDPAYLADLIIEEQITVCHFVPAMLAAFLAAEAAARCRCLRHVICSGEALPFTLQEQFFRLLPGQLHNLYGPTEAAVDVTYWRCERNSKRNIVPIGRPVANTRAYILDRELRPLPIGIPGELYIGGVQVGRGYYKRPELTAERFIPDPYSGDPEARLYKTGDICRWLEEGNIEYLGRTDFQVKIRGHRIELGEIEASLGSHPGILNVSVTAKDDGANGQYLVAFVVATGSGSPLVEELREFLGSKLPAFMVPSRFVFLDRLPLLENGKVNRKALSMPSAPDRCENTYVASSDHIEKRLVKLWESLLPVDSVGIKDDFFVLGGHSLFAATLLAEIDREFEIKLPTSAIFQAPTIEGLARIIRGRRQPALRLVQSENSILGTSLVPIQPAGSRLPLFCISGVGGGVFVFRTLARHLGTDQPIYGLQPPEPDGTRSALLTVPDIAAHYIRELRTLQPSGPYFLAGFSFGGMVAFEMASQLRAAGHQIGILAMFDSDLTSSVNDLPASARVQKRWDVYRFHLQRILFGPERIAHVKGTLQGWSAKLIYRGYGAFGRAVPPSVAAFGNILDVQTFAGRNYSPDIYRDRVTLFRCRIRPPMEKLGYDLGWGKVAGGGLDVYDVPGDHDSMWAEPHIRVLVGKLESCLVGTRQAPDASGIRAIALSASTGD